MHIDLKCDNKTGLIVEFTGVNPALVCAGDIIRPGSMQRVSERFDFKFSLCAVIILGALYKR